MGTVVALLAGIAAGWVLVGLVDGEGLGSLIDAAVTDPLGWIVAVGGFGGAFLLRSVAWQRLLPSLSLGQSMAAIHVALGANHVLPFRLGEPLRVVSVLARTNTPARAAAVSGVALRLGDVAALLLIAVVLAPAALLDAIGVAGSAAAVAVTIAAIVVLAWVFRIASQSTDLRRPDALTAALTLAAWVSESLLVWTVAGWGGLEISFADALLVTVFAVAAQLVAVAPGGVGTYEAAAVAALVLVGADPEAALVVAVAAHGLKTIYSLVTGGLAVFIPSPSLLNGMRLPKDITPAAIEPVPDGPVVLFLPAYQEGPRVADVIARAPATVLGRPLHVLVVDDGSTDDTVEAAQRAGATVHAMGQNRGLGRAVAVGFEQAIQRFDPAVVVFCDADGEYDPAEIENLVAPIVQGSADYVIGSRFAGTIRHMRPHRRFGNQALTRWVRWMTRTPVTDGQSGYRALSRQAAAATTIAHDYNYAQVLTIDLLQRGFRYAEVPIDYHFRDSGDSFVKLGRYLRAVVPTVVRLIGRDLDTLDATGPEERSVLDDVLLEPSERL